MKDMESGGAYAGTVGIFHEHMGAKAAVGDLDESFINGLPASVKFIAHRGAGYDSIAVGAAKSRGDWAFLAYGSVKTELMIYTQEYMYQTPPVPSTKLPLLLLCT